MKKNCIIFEYTLNDTYTLYIYWSWKRKPEITKVMKANLWTLQLLFRDDNLKVFQQKLIDIFWLYWSFTTFQMLLHYLSGEVFNIKKISWAWSAQKDWFIYLDWKWNIIVDISIFWPWSVQKNLWKCWEWDITIDISLLEKTIKEWKEKFKDKLDLLYLLLSNIIKVNIRHFQFFLFFDFIEEWKKVFNITDKDIKNQDINWEFKTYTMKLQYLYSYLFKEFFNDYVYTWPKKMISFYSFEKKDEIDRREKSLSDSFEDEDDEDDFEKWLDEEDDEDEENEDSSENEESNDNNWDEEDDFDDDDDYGNYDDDDEDFDDEEEEESLWGDYDLVMNWRKYIKLYEKFDLESLKKVALIIDKKLSEKYLK